MIILFRRFSIFRFAFYSFQSFYSGKFFPRKKCEHSASSHRYMAELLTCVVSRKSRQRVSPASHSKPFVVFYGFSNHERPPGKLLSFGKSHRTVPNYGARAGDMLRKRRACFLSPIYDVLIV